MLDPRMIPRGFRAAAVAAGIKPSGRPDVSIIAADSAAPAAGVFTTNLFVAAPVIHSRTLLEKRGAARAIVINAGNANAGTGEGGMADAAATSLIAARALGCDPTEVLVASTGVIGRRLPMEKLTAGIGSAAGLLSGPPDFEAVARAIMTTDTVEKVSQRRSGSAAILGMAKGAGMIHPNMATMLGFILTDAAVPAPELSRMLRRAAAESFNAISVDNDMSTNDSVFLLASGAAGPAASDFEERLREVCRELALKIVADGEGATKIVTIRVAGAVSDAEARLAADAVATSMLFKTAMHGGDPNWGRILAALGRSGAKFRPENCSVTLCGVRLFAMGLPTGADLGELGKRMKEREILVEADLGAGTGRSEVFTSDLSREYVSINADYTT